MEEGHGKGRSLAETPTWAVATVITVLVAVSFLSHGSLKHFGKWLDKTKRKSLLAALEKIKEVFVAKICVKSSSLSSRFYPCEAKGDFRKVQNIFLPSSEVTNKSVFKDQVINGRQDYCPEGRESFASYESLEQLHRSMLVLGITNISYSFIAIVLAMIKIYSWRTWENEAKSIAIQSLQDAPGATKYFQYMLTHQLPLSYDFLNYMLRSMEEEFRDIVGISVPLWIYAVCCIFLDFHGSNIYFWLSFLPAILILLIGTKLHRVVVSLAVEIMDRCPYMEHHQFNLRDELFWFGNPRFLLWLIHLISFQNAFEMATFLWSLWEIKEPSCFMNNRTLIVIRLSFGVISQFWCSFITFPLYVIVTQMGSRFKKSVISENVRKSLSTWKRRVKDRQSPSAALLSAASTPSADSVGYNMQKLSDYASINEEGSSSGVFSHQASVSDTQTDEHSPSHKKSQLQ
ncbi:MLO-like protein [Quillaja saponaria]|uniref:MLO-like protein n=1 Tax=Quillaja saponaria TaxID=32244 RepID=A0AAD7L9F4_QUISA|nr:MLO-like protein [Quillaja saponaria]